MGTITANPTITRNNSGYVTIVYLQNGPEPVALFACIGNPNGVIADCGRGSMAFDITTGDIYRKVLGADTNNGWNLVGNSSSLVAPVTITGANQDGLTISGIAPNLLLSSTVGAWLVGLAQTAGNYSEIATPGDIVYFLGSPGVGGLGNMIFTNKSGIALGGVVFTWGTAPELIRHQLCDGFALQTIGVNVPAATIDGGSWYVIDAAALDAQVWTKNEQGKPARVTDCHRRSSAALAKTNATLADIPGLTFNVKAGDTFNFRAVLRVTASATGGMKASVGGTATFTVIEFKGHGVEISSDLNFGTNFGAAKGDNVANKTAVTNSLAYLDGSFVVSGDGTVTITGAQNATDAAPTTFIGGACSFDLFSSS